LARQGINSMGFKEIACHIPAPSIFGNGPCSDKPGWFGMTTLHSRLDAIKEQVARLVRSHEELLARVAEQEKEVREQQHTCAMLRARVTELERENEGLRKAERTTGGGAAAPGSKERIDELVAEIDRCLELLNP
jgi:chromosome segregation ATPase